MTAEEFYHGKDAKVTDFTQLTPTRISPNYEEIFDFAESYHKAMLEDEEQRTERNSVVVSNFIDHCKEGGIEIPDNAFETFFNA